MQGHEAVALSGVSSKDAARTGAAGDQEMAALLLWSALVTAPNRSQFVSRIVLLSICVGSSIPSSLGASVISKIHLTTNTIKAMTERSSRAICLQMAHNAEFLFNLTVWECWKEEFE